MATQVTKPIISVIGGTQAGIRVLTQLLKQNNILNKVTLQLYEQESEVYYPDLLPYMSTNHISSFKCSKHISSILPKEVNIIRENPAEIDTKNQALLFESGEKHHYDYLILALDKQDKYQDVKGKILLTFSLRKDLGHRAIFDNFLKGKCSFMRNVVKKIFFQLKNRKKQKKK